MSDIQIIVAKVNDLRRKHQVGPVQWSDNIAAVAGAWSEQQASNHSFEHSGNQQYGENIYFYSPSANNFLSSLIMAIDSWYSEVANYDYNNPGFSLSTGHFTALVWASTTSIGAGVANDDQDHCYVTMNSDPPDNVEGQFQNNVFPPRQ